MTEELYQLHLEAGKICGEVATCGKKVKHDDEPTAIKAANSLNNSGNGRHVVEAYPCCWCGGWHIGRVMPKIVLRSLCNQRGVNAMLSEAVGDINGKN